MATRTCCMARSLYRAADAVQRLVQLARVVVRNGACTLCIDAIFASLRMAAS